MNVDVLSLDKLFLSIEVWCIGIFAWLDLDK